MRGEIREGIPDDLAQGLSVEKQQEQLLMNKLAASGKLPARPQSSFLQKKLQQRKFFDSGDYAMDKDKKDQQDRPHPLAAAPPVQQQLPPISPEPSETADDGLQIPTPDNVPQRKASIINPGVQCKLSPQPHVHHDSVPE